MASNADGQVQSHYASIRHVCAPPRAQLQKGVGVCFHSVSRYRRAGPETDYLVRLYSSQGLKTEGFGAERPLGYLLT